MKAWDPTRRMLNIYRVRSGLDEAATAFDAGVTGTIVPRIGTPIGVTAFLTTSSCDERVP